MRQSEEPFYLPIEYKESASPEKILVGLKRAVVSTFDSGRWKELAYLVGDAKAVEGHARLLRSLDWGDDDYGGHVFSVLRKLVGNNFENLETVTEYVRLREWLQTNDTKLYSELYKDAAPIAHVPLDDVEKVGSIHSVPELGRHAARIRSGLEDGSDLGLAIGSAKELLESVLRTVTNNHEQKPTEDIPTLLKKAQKELDIDPKGVDGTLPGADSLKRTLSNLGQVVIGVAEIRTLYGTGHGRSKSHELELAHARLVVNAAISIATFLLEVWEDKRS
jgi:AbiJ N-terminal domain 5/Abortive infection C-terminus